jgi:hypothetical protein
VLGRDPEYVKQIDANLKERFSRPVFRSNSIRNYRLKTITPASSLSKKIVHQKNDPSNLVTSMLWNVPRTPQLAIASGTALLKADSFSKFVMSYIYVSWVRAPVVCATQFAELSAPTIIPEDNYKCRYHPWTGVVPI